jgi:hypothetical protein
MVMDNEREALMTRVGQVRTRARQIIELCKQEEMPAAMGDQIKTK